MENIQIKQTALDFYYANQGKQVNVKVDSPTGLAKGILYGINDEEDAEQYPFLVEVEKYFDRTLEKMIEKHILKCSEDIVSLVKRK